MDDVCTLNTKFLQNAGHEFGEFLFLHAEDLGRSIGRIGERSQNVEDGGNANLLADGGCKTHRRVKFRREEKPDADIFNAILHVGWIKINFHAK
ncbi:MAG: hypothetical protein RBG13Loki_3734 [Promethearchaeota archaeon CR_4]|nr:MAG: hypothetical protein RBG13Loki_3734 [Candidatus Lokiarchaeota archaeon CR_4]